MKEKKPLPNIEKTSIKISETLSQKGLAEALLYLGNTLRAVGKPGHIRCFLYNHLEDYYIGLIEISIDGTDSINILESTPIHATKVPQALRVTNHTMYLNLTESANIAYLNSVNMANYRYVIRQPLFSDNKYECHLGITTNDASLCDTAVMNWIEKVTHSFITTLTKITNFQSFFGANIEQTTSHIEKIRACPGLQYVVSQIEKVSQTKITVLIEGETGVGKEYVAKSIHELSKVKHGPFIAVNCGAIPESLIESMLFGHEKGSFTGAYDKKTGYFEQAQNGTLFLDEIGELPLQAQVRLLRVLQSHSIQRIGSTQDIPLNIRIIAATHRNLELKVNQNEFREDLLYRLNAYTIKIPPLRERLPDIIGLCNNFLRTKTEEYELKKIPVLSRKEYIKLFAYPWNGNVRELENVINRAFIDLIGMSENTPLIITLPQSKITTSDAVTKLASKLQGKTELEDVINAYVSYVLEITKGKIYGKNGAAAYLNVHPNTLRSRLEKIEEERKD